MSSSPTNSGELPPGVQLFKGKVVVIGEYSVGKTSLSNRFVLQHAPPKTEPTIGAAFQLRTVLLPNTNNAVKLEIWDTAGSERYRSLMPMYYRDASVALVCYDICNAKTFDRVSSWIDDFRKAADGSDAKLQPIVVLVGTKSDLAATGKREIPADVALAYAQSENIITFETSARMNENVTEVFLAAASHIVKEVKTCEERAAALAIQQGVNGNGRAGSKGYKVDLRDAGANDTTTNGFKKRRPQQTPEEKKCVC
ncbi:ras-related GTP-binding protein, putative [Bodo saltans]|uniref:Ras-related GTP-binding protein, putative n=1 Tax=Bodo saltans TaxID=75058 RepID=A0A0S4JR87_BODSA|nr:ras-related GTP-binding protein, putative [Bodo saltans]|eukprot:CUG94037.1 ras-related GTP-binding protein, putative [Bodo saltans]